MPGELTTPGDAKKGWSSYCRLGNFQTCCSVQARCSNPRHGRKGQQPPTPPTTAHTPSPPRRSTMPAPDRTNVITSHGLTLHQATTSPPPRMTGATATVVDIIGQIPKDSTAWWTLNLTGRQSASARKTACQKIPELVHAFEFEARAIGTNSVLWVRRKP